MVMTANFLKEINGCLFYESTPVFCPQNEAEKDEFLSRVDEDFELIDLLQLAQEVESDRE